tara:strand:+ start:187 stop:636 length:450 start_codon:yes stop_codon:yes gene_type:complete
MKYITDIYSDKAFHWLQFIKHNNLGFLRLDALSMPPYKVDQDNSEEAINCYYDINDQVIQEFGIDESFIAQQDKKQEIALLKLDFIIYGNKMKRTEWRIKELEIKTPEEQEKNQMELSDEIRIVSKNIGTGIIDIKDYSIFQYLTAKKS